MFPDCNHRLQIMSLFCSGHEGTHKCSVVTLVSIKSRQKIMTFEASLVYAARPRIKKQSKSVITEEECFPRSLFSSPCSIFRMVSVHRLLIYPVCP